MVGIISQPSVEFLPLVLPVRCVNSLKVKVFVVDGAGRLRWWKVLLSMYSVSERQPAGSLPLVRPRGCVNFLFQQVLWGSLGKCLGWENDIDPKEYLGCL